MPIKKVSLEEAMEKKDEILTGTNLPKDEDIDYSDIPEIDFNKIDWSQVKVCPPGTKEKITIRIDKDVLSWFRKNNKYQKLMNKVLRSFYEANRDK